MTFMYAFSYHTCPPWRPRVWYHVQPNYTNISLHWRGWPAEGALKYTSTNPRSPSLCRCGRSPRSNSIYLGNRAYLSLHCWLQQKCSQHSEAYLIFFVLEKMWHNYLIKSATCISFFKLVQIQFVFEMSQFSKSPDRSLVWVINKKNHYVMKCSSLLIK